MIICSVGVDRIYSIMVSEKKVKMITRLVAPAIREYIGCSENIEVKVERCSSTGWTSERYILSISTEDEKTHQYYCKCFTIKDQSEQLINKYLENEFKGLQFAYQCFKGSANFCTPKPIALFKKEKTILMEYLKGKNLLLHTNEEVGKFGFKKVSSRLHSYYQKVGEMLRQFQNTSGTYTPTDLERNFANKEIFETGMLSINELTNVGISKSILNNYKDYIIKLEQNFRIDDNLLPVHWDFRPQNIIIEEKTNRLGLIDFQLYTTMGNPFRDPATLILSLIAYDMLFVRKSNIDGLIASFFSGYFSDGKPFEKYSMDLLDLIAQARLPWQLNSIIGKTSRTLFQDIKNKIICFKSERLLKNIISSGSLLRGYYKLPYN